jgi:hypothetical protein
LFEPTPSLESKRPPCKLVVASGIPVPNPPEWVKVELPVAVEDAVKLYKSYVSWSNMLTQTHAMLFISVIKNYNLTMIFQKMIFKY